MASKISVIKMQIVWKSKWLTWEEKKNLCCSPLNLSKCGFNPIIPPEPYPRMTETSTTRNSSLLPHPIQLLCALGNCWPLLAELSSSFCSSECASFPPSLLPGPRWLPFLHWPQMWMVTVHLTFLGLSSCLYFSFWSQRNGLWNPESHS